MDAAVVLVKWFANEAKRGTATFFAWMTSRPVECSERWPN